MVCLLGAASREGVQSSRIDETAFVVFVDSAVGVVLVVLVLSVSFVAHPPVSGSGFGEGGKRPGVVLTVAVESGRRDGVIAPYPWAWGRAG